MKRLIMDGGVIFILILAFGFWGALLRYKADEASLYLNMHEDYLNALDHGPLNDSMFVKDTLKREYSLKKLFGKGVWVISTVSPGKCAPCLSKQVKFLKHFYRDFPGTNTALIVIAYPNKEEITPWLKEQGIYRNYYMHFPDFLEGSYAPEAIKYSPWNFLFIDGKFIGAIPPPDGIIELKVFYRFLHDVLRKKIFY